MRKVVAFVREMLMHVHTNFSTKTSEKSQGNSKKNVLRNLRSFDVLRTSDIGLLTRKS